MAKSGIGERTAWKGRIDQSPWIDGTSWIPEDGDVGVEFLEVEPSAYRLADNSDREAVVDGGRRGTLLLALGAGAVVLVTLAIMSRPGGPDPFEQLPPDVQQQIRQRQAGPDSTAVEPLVPTSVANATDVDAPAAEQPLPDIPPLRDDLPGDLTGVVLAAGPDHRLLRIDWAAPSIAEEELEARATVAPAGGLVVKDGQAFLGGRNNVLRIDPSGDVEPVTTPIGRVLPSDRGVAVEVPVQPERLVGVWSAEGDELAGPWSLADDVVVLGGWRDTILVHKAGVVWSLGGDGGSEALARGELLGYDGVNLLLVNCSRVDDCRIEIGTPDRPAERTVAVPEALAGFDIAAWTSGFALSPDGRRLALATERGVATLLVWVDLETGEAKTVAESIMPGSPIAWSPDGRYLAATLVGEDLVIAREEDRRSWRLVVDRPIDAVVWVDSAGS